MQARQHGGDQNNVMEQRNMNNNSYDRPSQGGGNLAGRGVPAVDEKLLEEVFGKAGNDAGDSFLKDYIARQAWDEDAEENQVPLHQQVLFQPFEMEV